MKYVTLFLIMVLLAMSVQAVSPLYPSLGSFVQAMKNQTRVYSEGLMPDSVLYQYARGAIVDVSATIGGVEAQYTVYAVAGQALYPFPDSIVQVPFASIVDGKYTKSIKQWPPQLFEDYFDLTSLGGATTGEPDIDATPKAFNYWSDTLQLIPTPSQADTIIFKAFIRHSPMRETGDTLVMLQAGYDEAALYLACHKMYLGLQMYDEAKIYFEYFTTKAQSLTARYHRATDAVQNQEPKK
jgi:hypothetical protein